MGIISFTSLLRIKGETYARSLTLVRCSNASSAITVAHALTCYYPPQTLPFVTLYKRLLSFHLSLGPCSPPEDCKLLWVRLCIYFSEIPMMPSQSHSQSRHSIWMEWMISRGRGEGRGSRGERERDLVKSRVIWRIERPSNVSWKSM